MSKHLCCVLFIFLFFYSMKFSSKLKLLPFSQ